MANDDPMGIIELEDSLSDVEKPKEIPAGKYVGEIQDVQENTSAKGNTYYAIQFRVAPDELPADIAEEYEDGALLVLQSSIKPRSQVR